MKENFKAELDYKEKELTSRPDLSKRFLNNRDVFVFLGFAALYIYWMLSSKNESITMYGIQAVIGISLMVGYGQFNQLVNKLNFLIYHSKLTSLLLCGLKESVDSLFPSIPHAREADYDKAIKGAFLFPDHITQKLNNREITVVERHIWWLYLVTRNRSFFWILRHIIEGNKVNFVFKEIKNNYELLMIFCKTPHDGWETTSLTEPNDCAEYQHQNIHHSEDFAYRFPEVCSPYLSMKKYKLDSQDWLYWEGVVEGIKNALESCECAENITFEVLVKNV